MTMLLSPADAARILRVTPATIRQMASRGVLTLADRTEGGIRLFRREDVEALARARAKRQSRPNRAS
jgi:excisionase family DNA binding protein